MGLYLLLVWHPKNFNLHFKTRQLVINPSSTWIQCSPYSHISSWCSMIYFRSILRNCRLCLKLLWAHIFWAFVVCATCSLTWKFYFVSSSNIINKMSCTRIWDLFTLDIAINYLENGIQLKDMKAQLHNNWGKELLLVGRLQTTITLLNFLLNAQCPQTAY